jgi:putative MATE family efflux protein
MVKNIQNDNMRINEKTMTEGNPWILILEFAIPLLIGNLFQQLYNTADSIVVGRFVGREALAAVGSSNSLINLIIGLFIGIATGAGVLIAQYYGGKEEQKLRSAVHTAIYFSIIGGAILSVIGFFASETLLRWMGTPTQVIHSSTVFLKIYFLGSLFNLVYNMGAGILRAVGDSKSPLYYLCVASVVNIALDLLFVVVFHMGVAGAGLATITAQGVSAIMVMRKLITTQGPYRIYISEIKVEKKMFRRIVKLGFPAGIQNSIVSFSNVIIQANINSFGDIVMAGCSSYTKIDGFVILPVMSFSMSVMTYVGQNVGAQKYDRVKKGLFATAVMSSIYVGIVSIILMLFGKEILSIFTTDQDVIYYGLVMLKILIPFYITITLVNVFTGSFRGAGNSIASMVIMIANLCVVRVIWINVMTPIFPSIKTVLIGYPVSWITGLICVIVYSYKSKWLANHI